MSLLPEFEALADLILTEGLTMPENANDAQTLYLTLINKIENIAVL